VQAFNIGTMILGSTSTTWFAAGGGTLRNLGGTLVTADWLSRNAVAAGRADVKCPGRDDQGARDPGRHRAQNSFNRVVVLVKVARRRSSRRCWGFRATDRQCGIARLGRRTVAACAPNSSRKAGLTTRLAVAPHVDAKRVK
jgi:2-methylcitrate dehydratase